MITIIPQLPQVGTFASPIVPVPTGAVTVVLQVIMNAADIGARGNVINLCVIWSLDLRTPLHGASVVWQSGCYPLPGGRFGGPAPGLTLTIPPQVTGFAGQIVVPFSLNVGLAMDMLDAFGRTLLSGGPIGEGMTIPVPVYPVLQ